MKKIITSIAALVLFAGIVNAAETTTTTASSENKTNAVGSLSARSIAAIIEENALLRNQVDEMAEEADNLQNKLDYSHMMHTTLTTLKEQELNEAEENSKSKLDYARMMTTTLLNLNTVLATAK
jgi:dynactin complex subunit